MRWPSISSRGSGFERWAHCLPAGTPLPPRQLGQRIRNPLGPPRRPLGCLARRLQGVQHLPQRTHPCGLIFDLLSHSLDLARQQIDIHADVRCILAGDFRQLADLVGHHGEAPSQIARAGCFDGGVEREQVGLAGDLLNHLDDGLNLQARTGQGARADHRLVGLPGEIFDGAAGLG